MPLVRILLSRHHAPDAAARVVHVSQPSRDQVNMAVEDGLPSSRAAVDPDVEAWNGTVTFASARSSIFEQALDGAALRLTQVEVVRDMPAGDGEHVAFGHRKRIGDQDCQRVLGDHLPVTQLAERAASLSGQRHHF
jgi:hypothetical protein